MKGRSIYFWWPVNGAPDTIGETTRIRWNNPTLDPSKIFQTQN
jgi:hypothetical protein